MNPIWTVLWIYIGLWTIAIVTNLGEHASPWMKAVWIAMGVYWLVVKFF
ncbi:MAG: hypothetical protein ACE5FC_09320 [Myxococcota bacterium]